MHKSLFILLMGWIALWPARAQEAMDYSLENFRTINLPLVHIVTESGERPQMEMLETDRGLRKPRATNILPARMTLTQGNDTIYDSGDYERGVTGITIKVNGNSSSRHNNPIYKLKLQQPFDLLEREGEQYPDRHWRLMKDAITLKTMMGLHLCRMFDVQWVQECRPCNVFINGEYEGVYLIMENVRRKPKQRLNVSRSGFIVERDAYHFAEDVQFYTPYFEERNMTEISDITFGYTFRYPKQDKLSPTRKDSIATFIAELEESIADGTYDEVIDVKSFATWLLIHDIFGTKDSAGSNIFMTRYDSLPGTPIRMGNLWDFDSGQGVPYNSFANIHTATSFYMPQLLESENTIFVRAYKELWNEVREQVLPYITGWMLAYRDTPEAEALSLSRIYYNQRYDLSYGSVAQDVYNITSFMTRHLNWLDTAIEGIEEEGGMTTGAQVPTTGTNAARAARCYNLQGQPIREPKRGVYITPARRMMVR